MRPVGLDEIESLAIGAWILGTGGGGSPYHAYLNMCRLFREGAFAYQAENELFRVDSWVQVLLGQGIVPAHYHHSPQQMKDDDLKRLLAGLRQAVSQAVERMPRHQDFVDQYCKAGRT